MLGNLYLLHCVLSRGGGAAAGVGDEGEEGIVFGFEDDLEIVVIFFLG